MESLIAEIDTDEFEDNGWLLLVNASWNDDVLELLFDVRNGIEGSNSNSWLIKATSVHEYKIFKAHDCGLNYHKEEHVIIQKYSDPEANLFFNGKTKSPECVAGALYEAHVECVQDWIEFDKHINTEQKLSKLIQAGVGKLACGPIFLLQEYIKVLDRFGVNSNLADITPPKRWSGTSWVEYVSIPEMIHFGGSYIVADSFYASKQ